ncbi:MAG: hypothetical protein JW943_17590 [Deltaproteobacteria bacterium]|nr:hypothetical protein [Deltaproteobacteria bacterium]
MSAEEETATQQIKISQKDLHREEIFTDMQTGVIRQLTPVKINGEIDKNRKIIFFGQTQLMTQQGPLPIQFPIPDAKNLQQAAENFPQAMEIYVNAMFEEAQRLHREEQSRIIVPGVMPPESNLILK